MQTTENEFKVYQAEERTAGGVRYWARWNGQFDVYINKVDGKFLAGTFKDGSPLQERLIKTVQNFERAR